MVVLLVTVRGIADEIGADEAVALGWIVDIDNPVPSVRLCGDGGESNPATCPCLKVTISHRFAARAAHKVR
jgi:hypothetical protein